MNNQKVIANIVYFHLLHRWAGVHTCPSVSAVDMNTGGDSALTHAAPEGWMSRRLSQYLELSVSSCAKLHIKNAPFKKKKKKKHKHTDVRGISFISLIGDYQRKRNILYFPWMKIKGAHAKMWLIWIVFPTQARPIKRKHLSKSVQCLKWISLMLVYFIVWHHRILYHVCTLRTFLDVNSWIRWYKTSAVSSSSHPRCPSF